MSVMNTVTHSSTEMSISMSRLVRKYKLDICISDISLEEDSSSSEIGIATLQNPVGAESMNLESVTDPKSVKDDELEQYSSPVITAFFSPGDLAWYVDKEFFEPIIRYFSSWGISLEGPEICGFDVGVADQQRIGNPDFIWYCSLIYVKGYLLPSPLQSAKSKSLLEACNVTRKPTALASSSSDFLVIYNQGPEEKVETEVRNQLVARLGYDPKITPWENRPIKTFN